MDSGPVSRAGPSTASPANTGTPSRLLRVHQHKENTTRLLAAIDPGVVGRLLHDHVARLQMHVTVVEHHVDLAREDDRVVETAGAMHQRMLHRMPRAGALVMPFCSISGGILA